MPVTPLFQSFWMAGFECSTHINSKGTRLDMTAAVEHDLYCVEDYGLLRNARIAAARDGLRWHLIDRGSSFDWSSWIPMLNAARLQKIQVIWDLLHYGWPDGLDIFSPAFVDRFAAFARQAAYIHREHSDEIPFYAPVNEISFFAWAAARDLIYPWAHGRDADLKRQMIRAAIAATDNIRSIDHRARFIAPEPLIHTVPPISEPWNIQPALEQQTSQFEAWDILAGRVAPELGGSERHLDILGLNFYASNQWEVPGGVKLRWEGASKDPRWRPLNLMLAEIHERYARPFFIAETSHYGVGRAPWLDELAAEIEKAIVNGVPVGGACLYPIFDRFDWEDRDHWHNCGLWDFAAGIERRYLRVPNAPYMEALRRAQARIY